MRKKSTTNKVGQFNDNGTINNVFLCLDSMARVRDAMKFQNSRELQDLGPYWYNSATPQERSETAQARRPCRWAVKSGKKRLKKRKRTRIAVINLLIYLQASKPVQ